VAGHRAGATKLTGEDEDSSSSFSFSRIFLERSESWIGLERRRRK